MDKIASRIIGRSAAGQLAQMAHWSSVGSIMLN
jgi:hypothetical protein